MACVIIKYKDKFDGEIREFQCQFISDLLTLPVQTSSPNKAGTGSLCLCEEDGNVYILRSDGNWVALDPVTISTINDLVTGGLFPLSAEQGKILKQLVDAKIAKSDIADNLITDDANKVASAKQVKILNDKLDLKIDANDLANVLSNGKIIPYYIEAMAGFMWAGDGVPTNLTPYSGGNYYMEISGVEGENYVTRTGGGAIADAGVSTKWAAVIKDDSGNWQVYLVTGTEGLDKIYIYPNLAVTITAGEIGNLNDAAYGQHYTERGYKALAQYIYNALPVYADRNTYIAKFKNTDVSGSWVNIGSPFVTYNSAVGMGVSPRRAYTAKSLDGYCYGDGTTQGFEWTCNLAQKSGFLETFVGSDVNTAVITAEFYLDDILQSTVTGLGYHIERLVFPFSGANTGKIKIFIPNCSAVKHIFISDTTWWVNEYPAKEKMIEPSRVVYIGDSWGTFHSKALTVELARMINQDKGTFITVDNPSAEGMTSKWGLEFLYDHVIKARPRYCIIEFFTNDCNIANGAGGVSYTNPAGETSSTAGMTMEQWRINIRAMAQLCIDNGIQPIILCPCGQSTNQNAFNVYLTEGVSSLA